MKHSGPFQPRLVHEQPIWYQPASGVVVTGRGIGPDWDRTGVGTASHPAPANSFINQFRRTRVANVAAVADQELGVHLPNAEDASLWRGDAANLGGFYFSARFTVNTRTFTSIRCFVGLSAQTGTGVCVSDTVPNNTIGLWCDSTDAAVLSIVTKAAVGTTKNALTTAHTLQTGILYEFVMIANPNQANTILTHLINVGTGALISSQSVNVTLPTATVFMAPQAGMSNAANLGAANTAFDIISIYARPNQLLIPSA